MAEKAARDSSTFCSDAFYIKPVKPPSEELLMTKVSVAFLLVTFLAGGSYAACDLEHWRTYKGVRLLKHPDISAYAYKTSHVAIDADGSPDAYHPKETGISKTGLEIRTVLRKRLRNVFQDDEYEHDVLVLSRVHV